MQLKTCGALDIHHMNKVIANICFIIKCAWHMKHVCATQKSLSLTHGFVITAGTHEYTYPLCMYTYSNDFVHLLYIKAFENLFTNTTSIMDEEYIQIKHG